jgi:ribonucleoside-diphosphate reductase alpha chain
MVSDSAILVTKRDGSKEPLDLDKIHQVLFWATEDITGVSVSDIEMNSKIQFFDGIRTEDIHETMVKAAADLISEETPNYQYVAARLMAFNLRKEVLGQFEPIPLYDFAKQNIERGLYDEAIFEYYTKEEFEYLDRVVKHERDLDFTYAAMKQLEGKYLVQTRDSGVIYETPQYAYIMIAATIFSTYPQETRMDYVKRFYDNISTFKTSLPTPIMAGVRTPKRQYSSCVTIECDDSLDSIIATTGSVIKYISNKAGIGIGAGRIRGEGSKIDKGHAVHTGVTPFYRLFQSAVKSCSQGGVRGGAATLYVPIWHQEIEDILVLKNNKGTEDNRVRRLDYGIQFNKTMYERFLKDEEITLFSPHHVPDLYDAFFEDTAKFEELYTKYENDRKTPKTKIRARELFGDFINERAETGRIYFMNVDHANTHSAFTVPIRMSNLCCEIDLPTKPLNDLHDPEGEISLCTLSALNLGSMSLNHLDDIEERCRLTVRSLDQLLDYQDYPVLAAEKATLGRRPLGVGVINLAYYLAKNGTSYSDPAALRLVHETFEAIMFYLLKASMELAREKGACPMFHETKYAQGVLPIDTYKKDLDEIVDPKLNLDWEWLRGQIKEHGLRNSTLMALMPAETSAQISNATNGIEPPRALVSIKESKNGVIRQVVPEIHKLKNKYELLWNMPSMEGYIKLVGVMQKFVDQGISGNTSYNPAQFGGKVPLSTLLKDFLMTYKYGWKQGYYHNTYDGKTDDVDLTEEDCDSCKL